MSISVERSNLTLVFSKADCHANPGTEINFAEPSSHILRHIFLKWSNTSLTIMHRFEDANQGILLNFFVTKLLQTFFAGV